MPYQFKFQSGLNIIYGPNESGKTTIQEIIFHLLYTNVNTTEGENQKSWFNKNAAQARMVYSTEEKETFRLTKDFLNRRVLLECQNPGGWGVISDKKEQVNRLVKKHWKLMDKKVFNSTFFIKQRNLTNLDKPESLKIKDILTNLVLGTDSLVVSKAEKLLRQELEEIKGFRSQVAKRLSSLEAEQKKLEKHWQEEALTEGKLGALEIKLRDKNEQLVKLRGILEKYAQKQENLKLLEVKEGDLNKLGQEIEEVGCWEEKIRILDEEIKSRDSIIKAVDLTTLHNWRTILKCEKNNDDQLEKELTEEQEKKQRIITDLNRVNQGVDDYVANFGQKSLDELEKIEEIIKEENQELERFKIKERKLKNRIRVQKFLASVTIVSALCLLPWKLWWGGILLLIGACWFTITDRRKVKAQAAEKEEFIQELRWREANILATFFCDSKEELEQQIKRYNNQEQEICLKMKELEFAREKISRVKQQKDSCLEKIQKVETSLNNLFETTGLDSLQQVITFRENYENKIQEKQDWENKLWGKLGKDDLEEWKRRYQLLRQERDFLLAKLEEYKSVPDFSEEEFTAKIREKACSEEEIGEMIKDLGLLKSQLIVWQKQDLPSLNQLSGEIIYWQKKLSCLEDRFQALVLASKVLAEAVSDIQAQVYPELEKIIKDIFIAITNYSYNGIGVKENLDLLVQIEEFTNTVEPSLLSLGTFDQLYLALRIALGRVISKGKSIPFFLDDVLVNFDGTRRMKAMQILAKLAKDQQILLFTHDLQDVLPGYGVFLELEPLRLERNLEVS